MVIVVRLYHFRLNSFHMFTENFSLRFWTIHRKTSLWIHVLPMRIDKDASWTLVMMRTSYCVSGWNGDNSRAAYVSHWACPHLVSSRNGYGWLSRLVKGFNPQWHCLNPTPCCHGNQNGERMGYKWETVRGHDPYYVWLPLMILCLVFRLDEQCSMCCDNNRTSLV